MIIFYVILITIGIIALGSIVPLLQLLNAKCHKKSLYKYVFSNELVDFDMDFSIKSEFVYRPLLSTRGWVRGPQGIIMSNEVFEEKKKAEYCIQLP